MSLENQPKKGESAASGGPTDFVALARVPLPEGAETVLEVYVNSITQEEGMQYRRDGDALLFSTPIRREEKLGWFRWTVLFLGIVGSYGQNDSVDVLYTCKGKRILASALDIEQLTATAAAN
ncbi:MAG: hypothetical protein JHC87_04400 [Thermoleophilaceae bacterium]|nr:hypothetical protein [Thermoleophilaceae bacterium]